MATTETSAGYNFVPLSRKVVFPEWGPEVSQDIPFKDGISGTIECELEATSPIFVRNSGEAAEGEAFFNVDGQAMIPGTSLKGMLRNVIEIASFGKMSRVNDNRYGVRDLHNPKVYGNKMTQPVAGGYLPTSVAGWLKEDPDSGNWQITPCEFARIEQEDIERAFPGTDLGKKQPARNKYEKFSGPLEVSFECGDLTNHQHSCGALRYRRARLIKDGPLQGTLVFTGQPGGRQPAGQKNAKGQPKTRGKHMEFVFYNRQQEVFEADHLKKDFEFIHGTNGDPKTPNEEWGFWKSKLRKGQEIPIFFIREGGTIKSMGLAMMYRLPYENSIGDLLKKVNNGIHIDAANDLAECMFGYVGKKEGLDALKGRIQFSPAIATEAMPGERVNTVLGGPKPTYYPNYIEQPGIKGGRGDYKTMMDDDARLRGWKRYPARSNGANCIPAKDDQKNVATQFIPLQAGARFTFKIRVHNLKPQELGALFWALEWGGNSNLRHGLGMAKNSGLGQVKIKIANHQLRTCLGEKVEGVETESFLEWVNSGQNVPGWIKSEQIVQLLAIANPETMSAEAQSVRFAQIEEPQKFAKLKGSRENDGLNATLPPHVQFEGERDAEKFKGFDHETQEMKKEKAEKELLQQMRAKADRLSQVRKIDQWGSLDQQVLDNAASVEWRNEPGYALVVKEVAETIRSDKPKKWTQERDEKVAAWLSPAGLTWDLIEDESPADTTSELSEKEQADLQMVSSLKDWGDYKTKNINLEALALVALEALLERFTKEWGCAGSKAKDDKKAALKKLKEIIKHKK